MNDAQCVLTIKKADFSKAIKTISYGVKKSTNGNLTIKYDDGVLTMAGPFAETAIDAQGLWPVIVKLLPQTLKNLKIKASDPDPLRIKYQAGRFYIEGFSLPVADVE